MAKTWSVLRLTHADVNQAMQDQTARQVGGKNSGRTVQFCAGYKL